MTAHSHFTTARRRLDRSSFPWRLYARALRQGVWNPHAIDFRQDRQDWLALTPLQQDVLLRLTGMFQAREEAVTLDLLPLVQAVAQEGRLEEELFLTTFLADEAKHTDFFNTFLEEVAEYTGDLSAYHQANYQAVFYEALPNALGRLRQDSSPVAQVRAAVTYNLIVEGVLAETGYHAYLTVLEENAILPGQQQGIVHLKQDESRHIAFGIYLIERLIAAEPELWEVAQTQMNELLMPALGVVQETFDIYGEAMPFGLTPQVFTDYALSQFESRLNRIASAAQMTPAAVDRRYRQESYD
ncbi:MAG: R2-like ligand-binding oxidase [Chloroflexi bacterium]|nr:MAG: R2-like ligand-binding oxidase [Chloroflexota bacterium]